jgi:uncharacterized membrane protein YfcA
MEQWLLVGTTFVLAGLVKGVLGMGLPTIAMGLLSVAMAPAEAAALLVVPSLVTNLWQLLAGPRFLGLLRRLGTMMLGVVAGTLLGTGVLVGDVAGLATLGLGVVLLAYAVVGLAGVKPAIPARHEAWLSPAVGAVTGLLTGATGVFVLPAVPYLQAIGLERDDLVQALGLSFTVSTLALAIGLLRSDAYPVASAWLSLVCLAPSIGGMMLGQLVRRRIAPATFRLAFFVGLLLLGAYLVVRQIA